MFAACWADLRYGLRLLMASPGLTLAVTLSLGLGIGANVSIFTVVNAVLLRSAPVRAPDELVFVFSGTRDQPWSTTSRQSASCWR